MTTQRIGSRWSLAGAGAVLVASLFLPVLEPQRAFGQTEPQVEVKARLSSDAVDPGDTVDLQINVTVTGAADIGTPNLDRSIDFEIVGQDSSQSTRSTFVTGPGGRPQFTVTRQLNYLYRLRPKREGVLKVRPVEVVVGGQVYRTNELTVQVAPGAGQSQRVRPQAPPPSGEDEDAVPPGFPGGNIEDDIFTELLRRGLGGGLGSSRTLPQNPNEAFFIQVETDKTEAFVGEQITVSWYLYTRGVVREIDTLKYPSLKGFWKEDIEMATTLNFVQEVVNGVPYKKALLASFAIFPIKEGTAVIDSYTAKCAIIPPEDALGQLGMGRARSFTRSSQPVNVLVKPIPTTGRPPDYSGAVGDFQVSARLEDNNIVTHQPFSLRIRYEGRGNAKLINQPNLTIPEGVELYDVQNEAKFFQNGASFKEFNFLLIPRRAGEFTIPALTTSLFDPTSRSFLARSTEPISFRAVEGIQGSQIPSSSFKGGAAPGGSRSAGAPDTPVEPSFISAFESRTPLPIPTQQIAFIGLYALIIGALIWRARDELGWRERQRDLQSRLRVRLAKLGEAERSKDAKRFGSELTNAISFVLGQVAGDKGAHAEFDKMMLKVPPSVRKELGEELRALWDLAQLMSFAPPSALGKQSEPEALRRHRNQAEKALSRAIELIESDPQRG